MAAGGRTIMRLCRKGRASGGGMAWLWMRRPSRRRLRRLAWRPRWGEVAAGSDVLGVVVGEGRGEGMERNIRLCFRAFLFLWEGAGWLGFGVDACTGDG